MNTLNSSKAHTMFFANRVHKGGTHYNALQYMYTCTCKESTVSSPMVSSLEVEHLSLELMGESLVSNLLHY